MKKIINFIFDIIAFFIAVPILIYWRAERIAAKTRNYLKRK